MKIITSIFDLNKDIKNFKIESNLLDQLLERDYLMYTPYHSFSYLISILRQSAIDPTVKSIKITIYRLSKNSNVISCLINAAKNGKKVLWISDPMHGNTVKSSSGLKTRDFSSLLNETSQAISILKDKGCHLGGIHLEMTGQNVTECTGGAQKISDTDLSSRYHTQCDPRLNANQALELAFLISDEIKKNSSYSKNAIQAAS